MKTRIDILLILFFSFVQVFANETVCRIDSIAWSSEHSQFDESQMLSIIGKSCDTGEFALKKLSRYYEDQGFIGAQITGNISKGVLTINRYLGAGFVWANAENMAQSNTHKDVFQRLCGIEEGNPVSLTDLERSERRLARMGYFEQTAPTKLYRDSLRNRIIPAYSMRKANRSEAEGMLTYSSDDNIWEGMINIGLYNIAGTARDLRIEGFSGDEIRHLMGFYKEPWIFGSSWNVIVRGHFDEESFEGDTSKLYSEKIAVGELGITRDVGFDFTIGIYLGLTKDDKHSIFELSYVMLDRFILPRKGWFINGSFTYKMDRSDSLDNYFKALASVVSYYPIYNNFIARFRANAGGIFSTDAFLKYSDYFALGGLNDFKAMKYHAIRSRSYGLSEIALLWQDGYDLSIEFFYQPGLYRRENPWHGWAREQNYGIGFTQYRNNWSVNLYYALRNGCDYLEGILGFGLKTLF